MGCVWGRPHPSPPRSGEGTPQLLWNASSAKQRYLSPPRNGEGMRQRLWRVTVDQQCYRSPPHSWGGLGWGDAVVAPD